MEVGFVFLFVALIIGIRLWAGSMDGERIERYVSERGGRLLSREWTPFGPGWFGEKDSRLYAITFVDREGNTHEATCKTSMLSGVYLTEDRIVGSGPGRERDSSADLAEENRRLKAELERLRRGEK